VNDESVPGPLTV